MLGFLRPTLLTLLLFFAHQSIAQYFPGKDVQLNYNSVRFEFPWEKGADIYELVIYEDEPWKSETYTTQCNKYILNELSFGSSYYWKITSKSKAGKLISESAIMHFDIEKPKAADDVRFIRSTQKTSLCSNEYFIYDYAGIMMNRKNEISWFMPDQLVGMPEMKGIRDLKMTNDGTFLAIIDSMAFEFDLSGNIIWRAPNTGEISGMKTEDYHHDFQKLSNGNYMILGTERVRKRFKGEIDTAVFDSGTIIEYSPSGKIIWSWRAKDFFTEELLAQRRKEDGRVNGATHMNSFHVSGNSVYVGFRDASWILKIDKASKKVTEIYGGHDSGLPNHFGKELFHYQHDTQLLPGGVSMAVINNDSIKNPETVSSLVIFSLGDDIHDKGDLLFKFPFNFDDKSDGKSLKLGNVTELSNGNYLINMGALNRVIEIQPSGNVVWDCFTEKYDSLKRVWRPYQQYRVSTAASLHPNVFSAKWSESKRTTEQIEGKLMIYNIGSNDQLYTITTKTKSNKTKIVTTTKKINHSNQEEFSISIPLSKTDPVQWIEIRANESSVTERISIMN